MSIKYISDSQAIFVDFFDTLAYRHVTAATIVERWALCIGRKYPQIPRNMVGELKYIRMEVFKEKRKVLTQNSDKGGITEVDYSSVLEVIYEKISKEVNIGKKDDFIKTSKSIDVALECGSIYKNDSLINDLLEAKNKGKQIYCVSDYYLPASDLKLLMKSAGIATELFDGIYVSCDIGKRKAIGDIYPFLLEKLGLDANKVIMIGDNKRSDCEIPSSYGIKTDYRPNYLHKGIIHLFDKVGYKYEDRQLKVSSDEMFRETENYSEYIAIFYVFIKRLYVELQKDDVKEISFMAREGFYLKKLFEMYQKLIVAEEDHINTKYFWCSRRSVMAGIKDAQLPEAMDGPISIRNWLKSLDISIEEAKKYVNFSDSEANLVEELSSLPVYQRLMNNEAFMRYLDETITDNYKAFMLYMKDFVKENVFRFVDSGWKCTTQNVIENYYNIKTKGYYIGVQNPDRAISELERIGLIFSESNPRSKYYEFLGTNIPFYQQLLAAPHGTAIKYTVKGKEIDIKEEWDPMEKELFEKRIEPLQELMKLKFAGLCVWDDKEAFNKKDDWTIAKLSLRSSFFANGSRLAFIRECTNNYVQNFRQENRGKVKYDYKKVKLGIDLIWKPDKIIRYISKIQRTSVYEHKVVRVLYPFISKFLYLYIVAIQKLKDVFCNLR